MVIVKNFSIGHITHQLLSRAKLRPLPMNTCSDLTGLDLAGEYCYSCNTMSTLDLQTVEKCGLSCWVLNLWGVEFE